MNTVPDQADLPDLPDLAYLAEMVSATAARSLPSTRAGGQDYGSLTNSLKLDMSIRHRAFRRLVRFVDRVLMN